MPRGDRTGPAGMGPRTGRMAGYCAGNGMPGFMHPAGGGAGRGRGRGRCRGGGEWGWRNMYRGMGMPAWNVLTAGPADVLTPEHEKQALENQLSALQAELDAARKRLDEVSGKVAEPQG